MGTWMCAFRTLRINGKEQNDFYAFLFEITVEL